MIKKNVRIRLTDFINSNVESDIISYIEFIINQHNDIVIKLWYYPMELDNKDISKFKNKYKDLMSKETLLIYPYYNGDNAWFDIINEKESEIAKNYKFCSLYKESKYIINCLLEFNNFYNFSKNKKLKGENTVGKSVYNRFKQIRK